MTKRRRKEGEGWTCQELNVDPNIRQKAPDNSTWSCETTPTCTHTTNDRTDRLTYVHSTNMHLSMQETHMRDTYIQMHERTDKRMCTENNTDTQTCTNMHPCMPCRFNETLYNTNKELTPRPCNWDYLWCATNRITTPLSRVATNCEEHLDPPQNLRQSEFGNKFPLRIRDDAHTKTRTHAHHDKHTQIASWSCSALMYGCVCWVDICSMYIQVLLCVSVWFRVCFGVAHMYYTSTRIHTPNTHIHTALHTPTHAHSTTCTLYIHTHPYSSYTFWHRLIHACAYSTCPPSLPFTIHPPHDMHLPNSSSPLPLLCAPLPLTLGEKENWTISGAKPVGERL